MLKPNNSNIFTGYIKQLLASFNLPNCPVYDGFKVNGQTYLDNGNFKVCKNGELKDTKETYYLNEPYDFLRQYDSRVNEKQPENCNRTKTLKIKNNIYDAYTHEYLGDYLRFKRDYLKVDLMPLYNCFFPSICTNVNFEDEKLTRSIESNNNYLLYIIPVKANKKYTIALDSYTGIELVCGYYNKYLDLRNSDEGTGNIEGTYDSYITTSFNSPFVYDKLVGKELKDKDLKLFIKLKRANTTSIVILEGDYTSFTKDNKTIINFAGDEVNKNKKARPQELITSLQLLETNTTESYVFADRLIEYLVGNAITSEEEIADNIKRVQYTMLPVDNVTRPYTLWGAWDDDMRYKLYGYMAERELIKNDTLGYVDRNVEQRYINDTNENDVFTISSADLYTLKNTKVTKKIKTDFSKRYVKEEDERYGR